ncbi:hypothetical protein V9T40_006141 [Parthenolecanium corni]|uniref:Uncharacterized protein n=1 Tax=Parthenolecanium corni TaxID=536013 RepID=A0AAN9YBL5_9HEMI
MVDGDRKFCKRGGCEAVGSKMVENEHTVTWFFIVSCVCRLAKAKSRVERELQSQYSRLSSTYSCEPVSRLCTLARHCQKIKRDGDDDADGRSDLASGKRPVRIKSILLDPPLSSHNFTKTKKKRLAKLRSVRFAFAHAASRNSMWTSAPPSIANQCCQLYFRYRRSRPSAALDFGIAIAALIHRASFFPINEIRAPIEFRSGENLSEFCDVVTHPTTGAAHRTSAPSAKPTTSTTWHQRKKENQQSVKEKIIMVKLPNAPTAT